MNQLDIAPVNQAHASVVVLDNGAGLLVKFVGSIDVEDPGLVFDSLFAKIHDGMVSRKIPFVVADFTELAFWNSSGIKAVAKWVMKLAMLPSDLRYQIRINHNQAVSWQATGLPTLIYLVPGFVELN